jgi:hypothetical protein
VSSRSPGFFPGNNFIPQKRWAGGRTHGARRREGKDLTVIIISRRWWRSIVSMPGRRRIIASVILIGRGIIVLLWGWVVPLG